jgi:hypothetical protein
MQLNGKGCPIRLMCAYVVCPGEGLHRDCVTVQAMCCGGATWCCAGQEERKMLQADCLNKIQLWVGALVRQV